LSEHRRFTEAFESRYGTEGGVFSLACSKTVAERLLPGWMLALRGVRPAAQVVSRVENSEEVMRSVSTGVCEIGFIETPDIVEGLASQVLDIDTLKVVTGPGHRWALSGLPLSAQDIAATSLVLRERGSGTRASLQRALAPYPLAEPALELGSNSAVIAAVAAGIAPTVISELAIEEELRSGRLVALDTMVDLTRVLRAVWQPERPPRGAAAELIAIASAT
jgi:DNA-binding transcriptional LysR family regulator